MGSKEAVALFKSMTYKIDCTTYNGMDTLSRCRELNNKDRTLTCYKELNENNEKSAEFTTEKNVSLSIPDVVVSSIIDDYEDDSDEVISSIDDTDEVVSSSDDAENVTYSINGSATISTAVNDLHRAFVEAEVQSKFEKTMEFSLEFSLNEKDQQNNNLLNFPLSNANSILVQESPGSVFGTQNNINNPHFQIGKVEIFQNRKNEVHKMHTENEERNVANGTVSKKGNFLHNICLFSHFS